VEIGKNGPEILGVKTLPRTSLQYTKEKNNIDSKRVVIN
jgi:hypothetical protein